MAQEAVVLTILQSPDSRDWTGYMGNGKVHEEVWENARVRLASSTLVNRSSLWLIAPREANAVSYPHEKPHRHASPLQQ